MDSPGLPERLRQYEISERLSRDGKLRSYLALDTHSQRSVTLKTIRTTAEDRDVAMIVAQFKGQAQVSTHLRHPGILEVYEYGEDAGVAFLAMEFVQGCFLKSGLRMPIADAGSAVTQLLEALDYAHRLRVVHLDIQPACLLLTTKGRLRITDFGTSDVKPNVLAYASPERLSGEPADNRSDIFSAGACFYEWLTGTAPFGNSPEGIVERICHEKERPPSQVDSKIPAAFDSICATSLAKRPGDRYASAREFADEIRRAFVSSFGTSPREVLSNETVVSVFLSTLRGESRKGASGQPSVKPAVAMSPEIEPKPQSHWEDQTLKAVEYQLAPFIGAVAAVVVRNASLRTSNLEDLYRLAAESLDSIKDRQAFLAGRVPAAAVSALPKSAPPVKSKSEQPPLVNRRPEVVPAGNEAVPSKTPPAKGQPQKASAKAPAAAAQHAPKVAPRADQLSMPHPDSLADYLANEPTEIDDAIGAFLSATEALAALYASNGKSGGLTPASIHFDRTGTASIRASTSTSPQGATCFGSMGSPQYAAPEIFAETDSNAGPSLALSDIYALGFMFYEILLGRTLFRQVFASQRTDLDWLRWNTDVKSKAPTLKSLLPNRPTALSDLIQSMMAKEPGERPSDFTQILTRLRLIAQQSNRTMIGRAAPAHKVLTNAPSQKPRNTALKILLIVFALLLLLGVLIWQGPNLVHWLAPLVSPSAEVPKGL